MVNLGKVDSNKRAWRGLIVELYSFCVNEYETDATAEKISANRIWMRMAWPAFGQRMKNRS